MATVHLPRPHGRVTIQPLRDTLRSLREGFWVLALGVIVAVAFFVALGAFDPTESPAFTAVVGTLVVLWVVHAIAVGRSSGPRDPRIVHDRERRGF